MMLDSLSTSQVDKRIIAFFKLCSVAAVVWVSQLFSEKSAV